MHMPAAKAPASTGSSELLLLAYVISNTISYDESFIIWCPYYLVISIKITSVGVTYFLRQWRSQNTEKFTNTKGRLLEQTVISFNCVPFKMGTSLERKNLLPEGANSFL